MIDKALSCANARLSAQNIKIKIAKRGEKLILRGYFPSKDGSGDIIRQEIYLGLNASEEGVMAAEAQALQMAVQLKSGTFSWHLENNVPDEKKIIAPHVKNAADWIGEYEEFYFKKRQKTSASLLTWKKDYLATFRKLDWTQPLTAKAIEQAVLSTEPDTRVRQRCCTCFKSLAKFAGIEIDLSQWAGCYNPKLVKPRSIPSDEVITACYYQISDPAWRWCIGMLATYGLRNHELFRVDHRKVARGIYILTVNTGKTGFRIVYPIYPEWYHQFELKNVVLPPVNMKNTNHSLGHTVSQYFRRAELPFTAYDLRHAWAIRSLLYGLDVSLAAQMMGHSLKVHHDTYHQWISEKHYQLAFDMLMNRENRPLPPI